MKLRKLYFLIFILFIVLYLLSCATNKHPAISFLEKSSKYTTAINEQSFYKFVNNQEKHTLILFYNKNYPESIDMHNRFELFAKKFNKYANFCKFHWDMSRLDPKPYRLVMLPTVVLYKRGIEVDRIKGIPPKMDRRHMLDVDMEIWFYKNVLNLRGSGRFEDFLFKNSYHIKYPKILQ